MFMLKFNSIHEYEYNFKYECYGLCFLLELSYHAPKSLKMSSSLQWTTFLVYRNQIECTTKQTNSICGEKQKQIVQWKKALFLFHWALTRNVNNKNSNIDKTNNKSSTHTDNRFAIDRHKNSK